MIRRLYQLCLLSMIAILLPTRARADASSSPPSPIEIKQEALAFIDRLNAGEIAAMGDGDVIKTFTQMNPEVIATYLEIAVRPLSEYELWMRREERINGAWPSKPFLNYIKYRQQPRQVYMKWLDGGAKAGQEIIFDEAKRRDAMYGHIGGAFNVMSIWTSLNGTMAHLNSNHTINDLGVQAIFSIVGGELTKYTAEGIRPFPSKVEVSKVLGVRTVALTWVSPSSSHYAKVTKVYLELNRPMVRQFEAWNEAGNQVERIVLERIVPTHFSDADFDPNNKAYSF